MRGVLREVEFENDTSLRSLLFHELDAENVALVARDDAGQLVEDSGDRSGDDFNGDFHPSLKLDDDGAGVAAGELFSMDAVASVVFDHAGRVVAHDAFAVGRGGADRSGPRGT